MDRAVWARLRSHHPVPLGKSRSGHRSLSRITEQRFQIIRKRVVNVRKSCATFFPGKHLSEHCKMEYPALVNYCLWALAEVAVIAADIPEGSDSIYVETIHET